MLTRLLAAARARLVPCGLDYSVPATPTRAKTDIPPDQGDAASKPTAEDFAREREQR